MPAFNVVTQFGADNTGTNEASSQIQAAINAASAAGGGIVYLPRGRYKVSTTINPASNVNIIGAGAGATVILGYGNAEVLRWNGGSGNPLTNVTLADFEIDGSNMSNGGVYTSAMAGMHLPFNRRLIIRNLYVHDCGATGIGADWPQESMIIGCVCNNNGRLNNGTQAGGAGIGIAVGTNVFDSTDEHITVIGCTTRNNGTNGIFFENQSGPQTAYGIMVIGHVATGNGLHGIADAGCNGMQVIGGRSFGNGGSGFAAYKGTYSGASGPGINGTIRGLESTGNTLHGIHLDGTNGALTGYVIENCRIWQNATHGILIDNGAADSFNISLRNNEIYQNHNTGIFVKSSGGGGVKYLSIRDNRVDGNGLQTGAVANLRGGIRINCPLIGFRMRGNRCGDTQAVQTQTFGLYLDTVTLTGPGEIDGNEFDGNLTGSVSSTATFSSFRVGRNLGWTVSAGAPTFTAPKGTQYQRVDGAAGSLLYVNQDGATTWAAFA